jgi:hypothetical protein
MLVLVSLCPRNGKLFNQVSIYLMAEDDKDYCVHFLYTCVCVGINRIEYNNNYRSSKRVWSFLMGWIREEVVIQKKGIPADAART